MDKITELAKMIDHSLLHPIMTDDDLLQGCLLARAYNVATVCIKPYAIKQALSVLKGTDVMVCAVVGFPHGSNTIASKIYETEQACLDGAREIDMVINIGKALGGNWDYLEKEIAAISVVTKRNKAILKVIFENDFLPDDDIKIRLCQLCSKLKVEFIKTSTGYGFVKGTDGKYSYEGATEKDLVLMRNHSAPEVEIKAAGGVRTLDDLLHVKALGVTRVGATATVTILEEAKQRYGVKTEGTEFINVINKGAY